MQEYRNRQPFIERANEIVCPLTKRAFPFEQGSLQGRREAIAAQQEHTFQARSELSKVYGREVSTREFDRISRGESILPQKPTAVAVGNQREERNPFAATLNGALNLKPKQIEALKKQSAEWDGRKAEADRIKAVKESDDYRRAQTHAAASYRLAVADAESLGAEYVEQRRALLAKVEQGEIENYWQDQEPLDRFQFDVATKRADERKLEMDQAALKLADAKAQSTVATIHAEALKPVTTEEITNLPIVLE